MYLWLAVLAAVDDGASGYWLAANSQKTVNLLQHYPGLQSRYQRLSEAHLAQRPDLSNLGSQEREREQQIQQALKSPEKMINAVYFIRKN